MSKRALVAMVLVAMAGCGPANDGITGVSDEESLFLKSDGDGSARELERVLTEIRHVTGAFAAVDVAEGKGYALASPCVSDPTLGAMGFHYLNAGLLDGKLQLTKPEILVYEPREAGRLRLVAIEYMVPAEDWHRLHKAPPTFKGQPFDDHRQAALRHGIPFAHYDLHLWLYRTNPAGLFAPFNPEVSCRLAAPAPAGSHSH